jgi:hypothetical protein
VHSCLVVHVSASPWGWCRRLRAGGDTCRAVLFLRRLAAAAAARALGMRAPRALQTALCLVYGWFT